MQTTNSHSLSFKPVSNYFNWVCLGASVLLMLLAPSGDSFWIDEANSAHMAVQPGLASWWQAVTQISSDVQMSPYFLQLWGWEKVAGAAEWNMRLDNLLWVFLGIGAWFVALPRSTKGMFALVAGVSPFLWYYASEIRPYAMLFGASSLMFASLFQCAFAELSRGRFLGVGMGALLAIGASSAALPWVGMAFLFLIGLFWQQKPDLRSLLGAGVALAIPAAGLACLYLWSFSHGARASSPEPSSIASLLFVPYELLGFTGLGPGRTELRTSGIGSLRHYLPQLGLLFGCLVPVSWAAFTAIKARIGTRRLGILVLACVIPALAITVLGVLTGLRTTGRHFTPALALILPVLALGAQRLWNRSLWGRGLAGTLLLCLLASSIQIRVAQRHKKENYREAARIARSELESGHKVWWAADPCGADYYGVPVGTVPGTAQLIRNLEKPVENSPDIVVLSRPDVYDSHQIVTNLLSQSHFQLKQSLQSFTIWEKTSTP